MRGKRGEKVLGKIIDTNLINLYNISMLILFIYHAENKFIGNSFIKT